MSVMTRRILVNLPEKMYRDLMRIAKAQYKSVSGIIRESIFEKLNDEFSDRDKALIDRGRSEYRLGKGVNWRSVKRG